MLCPMDPEPLKTLPENWSKAVAIVAHPDDMEFGAAAAVARWTGQGKQIVLRDGHQRRGRHRRHGARGVPPGPGGRADRVGRIVGVDAVEFLGLPDGIVEYGVPLRRTLAEVIRRHQPEIVLTGNFRDTFGPGRAQPGRPHRRRPGVLDAARDAGNRWIFNDQLVDGLEPWGGVKAVWAFGSPEATHGVDTTETFDAGVASLAAHAAYIEGLGWENWDPREFLEGFGRQAGQRLGVPFATSAEVYSLTWGGDDED